MSNQEILVTVETEGEPQTLFDELAGLVPEERQAEYYRVIAHTRTLSPNDEMLRILEAMGVLALLFASSQHFLIIHGRNISFARSNSENRRLR